jgi:competence protein ComEA
LPGIGETKAKAIIQYREQNNGFDSIEKLQEVNGIGPATFESLKELVTVN